MKRVNVMYGFKSTAKDEQEKSAALNSYKEKDDVTHWEKKIYLYLEKGIHW